MNMKSLTIAATALGLFAAPAVFAQAPAPAAPAAASANPIVTTLKAQWQGVATKVIDICEIIPEDKLDYKATPDVRSFKDLIIHIAGEGYTFLRSVGSVPGVTPPTNQELAALNGKAALMKALRDSYEWQGKVIDSLTDATASELAPGRGGAPGTTPKWNQIVGLLVDNMDHYGNLVTYVRLNGMVPPTTAAAAARRGGRGGAPGGGGGPGGGAPGGGMGAPAGGAPARGQ